MKTVNSLVLTMLVLVVCALFAASPAVANKPIAYKSNSGWNTSDMGNVGDEPQAAGQVSYGRSVLESGTLWPPVYSYEVKVKCQHLKPGATYRTPVGTFTANKNGSGMAAGRMILNWDSWSLRVTVDRLDVDGSTAVVLAW